MENRLALERFSVPLCDMLAVDVRVLSCGGLGVCCCARVLCIVVNLRCNLSTCIKSRASLM